MLYPLSYGGGGVVYSSGAEEYPWALTDDSTMSDAAAVAGVGILVPRVAARAMVDDILPGLLLLEAGLLLTAGAAQAAQLRAIGPRAVSAVAASRRSRNSRAEWSRRT